MLEMRTQRVISPRPLLETIYSATFCFFLFFVALWPNAGPGLLIHEVSRSHSTTHHSR